MMSSDEIRDDIAIIGMVGRFPESRNLDEFWDNLISKRDCVTFFDEDELRAAAVPESDLRDPNYVRAMPVLPDFDLFDAAFFGLTPREADIRDPQQRVFLEAAYECFQDAGYDPRRCNFAVGVYGGVFTNRYAWLNVRRNVPVLSAVGGIAMEISNHSDYLSTLVAYKLDLRGPALTVATACSTSMVAIHLACQALRSGECDMALAGGVEIELPAPSGYSYVEGGILSPDGLCRAFDAAAQGTIFGSGCGVILLKRLEDALAADGDRIRAVIRGSAMNNDGAQKVGFTAPSVEGQRALLAEAYGVSGIDPTTVSYVEAHGTGTALGDPVEVTALNEVFLEGTDRRRWCGIGTVKTNIGHMGPASGVVGVIKTVLALERGLIPPIIHFENPNPKIDFENSAFYVVTEPTAWDGPAPRRAGVSSFGIGGTNAHVILEQAPAVPPSGPSRQLQVLLLSARKETALKASADRLAAYLLAHPETNLADAAYTLQVGREMFRHRMALVADSAAGAADLLQAGSRAVMAGLQDYRERPIAFMFPGQGTQHPNMARELYQGEPAFRETVDTCCAKLGPQLGIDLRELLYPPDGAEDRAAGLLAQTRYTQPALFVIEYALAQLLNEWGIRPKAMIGHSVGEYVAACLAGVFTLDEALALIAERGALMQSLPAGTMAAVPLPDAEVEPLLAPGTSIAAVNAPGMCVISGSEQAVEATLATLGERGVEAMRLRTSHAFHSQMMEPILGPFTERVAAAAPRPPAIPIVSNLTGTWMTDEEAVEPRYWAEHLRRAVRFADGAAEVLRDERHILLEVGPGQTLTGLAGLQPPGGAGRLVLATMRPPQRPGSDLETLLTALGRLWVAGVNVDWNGFYLRERRHRVELPTYPFERRRHWVEPMKTAAQIAAEAEAAPDEFASPGLRLPIAEWFSIPAWKRREIPTPAPPGDQGFGPYLLLAGSSGMGELLAERLRGAGETVEVACIAGPDAASAAIEPTDAADYADVVGRFKDEHGLPGTVVHLWMLDEAEPGQTMLEQAQQDQLHGYHSLCHVVRALARYQTTERVRLMVVGSGIQDPNGSGGLRPGRAGVLGVTQVLPREMLNASARTIDVQPPATAADREQLCDLLMAELTGVTEDDDTVAYRGLRRWVRAYEAVRLQTAPAEVPAFRPGGVCLITGGLGAVGLTFAGQLAREAGFRLALVGRTEFPDPSQWDSLLAAPDTPERLHWQLTKLRAIEAAGGEVLVLSADSTDPVDMAGVVGKVHARFGPITGVVHAAGVAGGGMLALKSTEAAAQVLRPKIEGAAVLYDLLGGQPLDFFMLCSSLISVSGDFGEGDYCGANSALDAFAARMQAEGIPAVSINYPAWLEIGMAAETMAPSAFRDFQRGASFEPCDHPLLEHRIRSSGKDAVLSSTLTPTSTWVLDEHRMDGVAVLPGVGYLELARAAFAQVTGSGPVEIRDVVFMAPLRVTESREVRTIIRQDGPGQLEVSPFTVVAGNEPAGQEPQHWTEFGRGGLRKLEPEAPPVHDLAAIRARCPRRVPVVVEKSEHNLVDVGAHWNAVTEVFEGENEELALIEIPHDLAADLGQYGLHPALLDCATTFAQTRIPADYYLPFGYGRVVARAPLPERFYTHIRHRDAGTSEFVIRDITLIDESGEELVAIDSFTLRRVSPEALDKVIAAAPAASADAPADEHFMDRRGSDEMSFGVHPEEAVDAFRRILAADLGPQAIVCVEGVSRKLHRTQRVNTGAIVEELAAASLATPAPSERNVSMPYAGPETDLEKALCQLWQDSVGVVQIGIDDDFFELGGNSLVAVQLAARVRDRFKVQLALPTIFESPTVRLLGQAVEAAIVERLEAMTEEDAAILLGQDEGRRP